jgi:hypothetical protein
MKKRKTEVCAYCIANVADTRDHVIPLCLFERPYPDNLITVPACQDCNVKKSLDDDFLRDYLTTDFAGNTNPTAERVFQQKVRRSVWRNSSELGRSVLGNSKEEPFYTKGGVYLGQVVTSPIDEKRIVGILGTVIRGLFRYHAKDHIPLHYPVEVFRIMPWDAESAWRSFAGFNLSHCRTLGDVFAGSCARVAEDVRSTFWLLAFYSRVHFLVSAVSPELRSRND